MNDRTERNAAIVRQLEIEANISAGAYLAEVEEFQRLYRLERMQDIVFDLTEWIEAAGDLKRLADRGVRIEEDDAVLRFVQAGRSLRVRARDDMSISVDDNIMYPDTDCPVLDKTFYEEVMTRVFAWADADEAGQPKRYFE
ncbi:MAG: hypothetical protein KJ587_07435 [Alphaproteobacteria bacterium]|nr:hypothetical protein [Alphaproteobacteria bacterium]